MRITRNNAANLPIFVEIRKFSQKTVKIFAYSKKMLYFCSTKFQDIHNKDFIPMCKHSRGERESELLFFPLKGEYPKSPFKGDLEGLGI